MDEVINAGGDGEDDEAPLDAPASQRRVKTDKKGQQLFPVAAEV
jgi:hypothetical protein